MKRLLLAAVALALCSCAGGGVSSRPGDAMKWRMDWSDGTSLQYASKEEWHFVFPKAPGHVNMVTESVGWATAPATVSATFVVTAKKGTAYSGVDSPCAGNVPPTFRFYFEGQGTNYSGSGGDEWARWWSNPVAYQLGSQDNTTVTMTTKVSPDQWSNVWGKYGTANPTAFKKAWAHPSRLGFTWGACGNFGHGVNATTGPVLTMQKVSP